MKKFLLNVSKRNIPRLFIVFLVMLLMILFSSAKTVYAASGSSSNLYECQEFIINDIYNNGTESFISIRSKLRNGSQYAQHMNFTYMIIFPYHRESSDDYSTYSLTLLNGDTSDYYYGGVELYSINNLCEDEHMIHGYLESIGNNDYEYSIDTDNPLDITYFPYKTIRWATAYAYIHSEKSGWPWEGNKYRDFIYFSLFVDNIGKIEPSQLKSLKFAFKDKNDNWVYITSIYKKNGTKDISYSQNVMGVSMKTVDIEDAYYYDLSEPSRTDGLRNSFKASMYGTESGVNSLWLSALENQQTFDNWPSNEAYEFEYFILLENAPKLNKGATRSNQEVDNFAVVQFSYVDEVGLLTGASLYNSSQTPNGEPVIGIIDDISGEEIPVTIDPETGDLNDLSDEGWHFDEWGNLIDPDGYIVDFDERNENIANKPGTIFTDWFNSLSSLFKKLFTIALLVIGIILVLKIFNLIGKIGGKKDNNVNIHVRTGSNKSKKRRNNK